MQGRGFVEQSLKTHDILLNEDTVIKRGHCLHLLPCSLIPSRHQNSSPDFICVPPMMFLFPPPAVRGRRNKDERRMKKPKCLVNLVNNNDDAPLDQGNNETKIESIFARGDGESAREKYSESKIFRRWTPRPSGTQIYHVTICIHC